LLDSVTQDLGALLVLGSCVLLVSVLWPAIIGAAWTQTSSINVSKMLDMAQVGPEDIVYDLGSGDGRIIIAAAKRHVARAVGVEADPIRVALSRFLIWTMGLSGSAKVVYGNFFHSDISSATVVTLFLTQGTNRRLRSKLQGELRKGTRVVSYSWTFEGWTPTKSDPSSQIYLYIV